MTTTFPNSYLYNSHSVSPPPMSIMAYFYNYNSSVPGEGDPDGWVICDGLTRTVIDNRFAIVAPLLNTIMGVTSNTSNSITPPNLKSQFLYGSPTTSASIGATGGASSVTLTVNEMPSHSHAVTDPGHDHTGGVNQSSNTQVTPFSGTTVLRDSSTSTGSTTTGISIGATGGGNPVTILPPYMYINYIMKY